MHLHNDVPRRQLLPVHAMGCGAVKRPMRPLLVIEHQIARQALVNITDGHIGIERETSSYLRFSLSRRTKTLSRHRLALQVWLSL